MHAHALKHASRFQNYYCSINLYNRDNYHELGYPKDPDDINWKILDMNISDNYIGTPLPSDKTIGEMNIQNNSSSSAAISPSKAISSTASRFANINSM